MHRLFAKLHIMTTNQSGNLFERMELLYGKETVNLLSGKTVMIVGIGGVGGYAAELIVRSGVGNIIIIDGDTVEEGNINRQIIATHSTVGRYKVDVMKARMLSINPDVKVNARKCKLLWKYSKIYWLDNVS